MALPPMRPRSFKCDDSTWDAASRVADERGENLSDEIRRFLRRYGRRHPVRPATDQPERPA